MRAFALPGWLWILAAPALLVGECTEKAAVQMDERASESHIVARSNPEYPSGHSKLLGGDRVVVLVTVDRSGSICDVKAVKGPPELRELAAKAVREHWKFRPFLVNWKPVVAQFPVTVRFVRVSSGQGMKADLIDGLLTGPSAAMTPI